MAKREDPRRSHGRRRLPRPQRRHPRGREDRDDGARMGGGRRPRRLRGPRQKRRSRFGQRRLGHPHAGRHDPRHVEHGRSVPLREQTGRDVRDISAQVVRNARTGDRRPRRHRRRRDDAYRAGLCERGLPVVGVPKTIDNDLAETDVTFGFDSATQVVSDAIDRLHTTAMRHHRVMVVEVMGRYAGWLALAAGWRAAGT